MKSDPGALEHPDLALGWHLWSGHNDLSYLNHSSMGEGELPIAAAGSDPNGIGNGGDGWI